jgi:hypothetical protein
MRKIGMISLLLWLALCAAPAFSQSCAMCRANAKATPKEGQRAINRAIFIMLAPPVGMMIFGAGFVVRYVRRRDQESSEDPERDSNS